MANSKRTLFLKRRLRVRNKLRRSQRGTSCVSPFTAQQKHQRSADRRCEWRNTRLGFLSGKVFGRCRQEQRRSSSQGWCSDRRARKERLAWKKLTSTVAVSSFHGKVKAVAEAAREGGLKI